MPKDIRDILKNDLSKSSNLSSDHRENFVNKLAQLQRPKKNYYFFLKIAASIVLLISLGYYFSLSGFNQESSDKPQVVNLDNLSPELKQIENYYLTAINYEMASIEPSPENKDILDSYLKKIAELTAEYKLLSLDLIEKEINEKTVNDLITNLQLRLQLLLDLKDTLSEMKTPKNIENENNTI